MIAQGQKEKFTNRSFVLHKTRIQSIKGLLLKEKSNNLNLTFNSYNKINIESLIRIHKHTPHSNMGQLLNLGLQ